MHGGRCSHLRYRGRLTQRLRPTGAPGTLEPAPARPGGHEGERGRVVVAAAGRVSGTIRSAPPPCETLRHRGSRRLSACADRDWSNPGGIRGLGVLSTHSDGRSVSALRPLSARRSERPVPLASGLSVETRLRIPHRNGLPTRPRARSPADLPDGRIILTTDTFGAWLNDRADSHDECSSIAALVAADDCLWSVDYLDMSQHRVRRHGATSSEMTALHAAFERWSLSREGAEALG